MRVFQIQDDWGMDHLQLATRPEPRPGPGQVLMRMKTAALNYRDLLVPNRGYGSYTGNLPLIPVSDGVGEVVEVGAGVTQRNAPATASARASSKASRRRAGLARIRGRSADRSTAPWRICGPPDDGVVKVPAYLSDHEAATLPCAAVTAWSALVTYDTCGRARACSCREPAAWRCSRSRSPSSRRARHGHSSSDEKIAQQKRSAPMPRSTTETTPEW